MGAAQDALGRTAPDADPEIETAATITGLTRFLRQAWYSYTTNTTDEGETPEAIRALERRETLRERLCAVRSARSSLVFEAREWRTLARRHSLIVDASLGSALPQSAGLCEVPAAAAETCAVGPAVDWPARSADAVGAAQRESGASADTFEDEGPSVRDLAAAADAVAPACEAAAAIAGRGTEQALARIGAHVQRLIFAGAGVEKRDLHSLLAGQLSSK
eukprot:m51a1_g8191 hypothetical protein (219) ;mRNA; f:62-796